MSYINDLLDLMILPFKGYDLFVLMFGIISVCLLFNIIRKIGNL